MPTELSGILVFYKPLITMRNIEQTGLTSASYQALPFTK